MQGLTVHYVKVVIGTILLNIFFYRSPFHSTVIQRMTSELLPRYCKMRNNVRYEENFSKNTIKKKKC